MINFNWGDGIYVKKGFYSGAVGQVLDYAGRNNYKVSISKLGQDKNLLITEALIAAEDLDRILGE
jgi:ribosomal protein L21E